MTIHTIKLSSKEDSQAVKWVSLARSKESQILNTLRIDNNTLISCDGHRIHKIETPETLQEYNQKSLKPLQNIPVSPQPIEFEEIEGNYPDWQAIIESAEDKEIVFQIAVNKKLLADLAKMPTGQTDRIILQFTNKHKPIKIIAPDSYDKAEAFIMPMHMNR